VVVTGVTGFLGSYVVPLLLQAGYDVVGIKKKNSNMARLGKIVRHPRFSLHDYEDGVASCFSQPVHAIVHLATNYGRDQASYAEIVVANVVLPLELLELGVKQGSHIFINADTFFHVKLHLSPKETSYITTKKLFLDIAKEIASLHPIKFANLRIEQMYGPRDNEKKFITTMISELLSGKPSLQLTEGIQRRDFVYVEDVARAFVASVQHADALPSFIEFGIGTGKSVGIRDVVLYLKKITKSTAKLAWGAIPYRKHEIMDSKADLKKNALISWRATTKWKKGLQTTVDSFVKK